MGNACCNHQEIHQNHFQSHTQILIPMYKQTNIWDSFQDDDDENISSIKQYITPSAASKVDLDFSSDTNQSKMKQTIQLPGTRKSVKISYNNFVTMKQGEWNEQYSILKKLGQGSYGSVWLGQHKKTGILRALKQIKKDSLLFEDQQRMLSELNILKSLDHPNIVRVFECFQEDNQYIIVTEQFIIILRYLPEGELFERIKKLQCFSERMAADYIKQILQAVNYCHDKQIVHRDIKPENILLSGQGEEIKVIDFGTSRYFSQNNNMNKRLGTPYYIAPEVLNGQYNEKVDIWSCGVILYIFLCGYPPFIGKNENEIFEKVKKGKLIFDKEDWSTVSKDAQDLIGKMLNINANKRFSAKQALLHPWVQKNAKQEIISPQLLNNIQKFYVKSNFQKAIMTFMVNQTLQNQEISELKATFHALDKNHDGNLNKLELIAGYQDILKNKELAEEKVNKILDDLDLNHSNLIDYSEFIMGAMKFEKLVSIERIKLAFRMLDTNGDGYISKEELEDSMGFLEPEIWESFLKDCDLNKDGKISEEEFTNILVTL
ncbi:unnamed protein product [Paramecium pentaurelia]|uniref:Calcium-dependent protein kinase 1 n=1 Tax=Paramecium pentaurelia TaxID=43138 RepID=A0A8S1V6T3_9CILI|nr:unnamed protein product [Paramecium pentaurelia]